MTVINDSLEYEHVKTGTGRQEALYSGYYTLHLGCKWGRRKTSFCLVFDTLVFGTAANRNKIGTNGEWLVCKFGLIYIVGEFYASETVGYN